MVIDIVGDATCDMLIVGTLSWQALPTAKVANGGNGKWLGLHVRVKTPRNHQSKACGQV